MDLKKSQEHNPTKNPDTNAPRKEWKGPCNGRFNSLKRKIEAIPSMSIIALPIKRANGSRNIKHACKRRLRPQWKGVNGNL